MVKLIQKKDNALLTYFIQNYTSQGSQTSIETLPIKQSHIITTLIEQENLQSLSISTPN